MSDELRIYLVLPKDVGERMSKAKFGVQCAHGALSVWARCLESDPNRAHQYLIESQPKITVEVKDTAALMAVREKAIVAGFHNEMITDLGRTEFLEPTVTVLAIGPIWFEAEAKTSFIKRLQLYKSPSQTPLIEPTSLLSESD